MCAAVTVWVSRMRSEKSAATRSVKDGLNRAVWRLNGCALQKKQHNVNLRVTRSKMQQINKQTGTRTTIMEKKWLMVIASAITKMASSLQTDNNSCTQSTRLKNTTAPRITSEEEDTLFKKQPKAYRGRAASAAGRRRAAGQGRQTTNEATSHPRSPTHATTD